MFRSFLAGAAVAAVILAHALPAYAHGGEDHGAPPALPPIVVQPGNGGETDLFQVVLQPDASGGTVLYLADSHSNAPIANADITIEAGSWRGRPQPTAQPGVYRLDWQPLTAVDVMVTVSAQGRDDLLLLSGIGPAAPASPVAAAAAPIPWPVWAGAALLVLVLAVMIARARRRHLGATALQVLLLLAWAAPALAHSGHDHGGDNAAPVPPAPGQIITVPKAAQFLIGVLTEPVAARQSADNVRVPGRVIPDPQGFARIQPSQAGRVVGDPAFALPVPGQRVKRGDVLVVLEPVLSGLERSGQRGALYRMESEIALQERELARQEALGGVVTAKALETSRIRLGQMRRERAQIAGTALGRELVTAPMDGVIADLHVMPGEVIAPDKVMVEIVDPARLRIEAVIHDLALADTVTAASATSRLLPDMVYGLDLLGISPRVDLVDQGIHAIFAPSGGQAQGLRIGMPVDVHLSVGAMRLKLAVPRQAVVDHGGAKVVFLRTGPESFEIRPVKLLRSLGAWAEIDGVAVGDKVVVQGMDQLRGAR
ncbi:efflux RND transporter periplasmic adaptor subunit [Magnetospirillum sulfuroxidans]|uniref:Efflux RND transporter periplasmic adaptor subunit n=1 Tax=Magnetospirillum sulfuroxidans TaxID=611300 RepID=A0ABS5IB51_9PROT|nr:efflux RND transporter periplasmic adaptor subunit [Magnetospirillum sulfuroxidans]MBR9971662.1 efflux RND transporter periplasmic adaptor subunit [Magnetospirillum sulfuroxidans]